MRIVFAASLAFLNSYPASAAITGEMLLLQYEAEVDDICFGFIAGAIDGIYFGSKRNIMLDGIDGANVAEESMNAAIGLCSPPDFSKGQAQTIVTAYLLSHPESLEQEAVRVIRDALSAAFPCQ